MSATVAAADFGGRLLSHHSVLNDDSVPLDAETGRTHPYSKSSDHPNSPSAWHTRASGKPTILK